uniref:Ig-like domain-containing protein n=1 Tax=Chrysemys picta bellii TaxID=8478 RepID=A0A8C3IS43_CHRPI
MGTSVSTPDRHEWVRAEAGAMELSRILGDSVTFPLGIPAEQVTAATWTVNTTRSIVTVAAGNPPTVIVLDPSYEGRLRVPESNSLQITSLRMEDTGTYSAQIRTATGIIHRPFPLRVYSKLPEPTVLCDSVTCVNETCNYNLSCRVRDGGEHVTYSWTHTAGGAVVPNESIHHISQSPRDAHLAVTCTAQNPASNSSTTASAKDLCAGNSLCRIALPSAHRGELASGRCLCTSPRERFALDLSVSPEQRRRVNGQQPGPKESHAQAEILGAGTPRSLVIKHA